MARKARCDWAREETHPHHECGTVRSSDDADSKHRHEETCTRKIQHQDPRFFAEMNPGRKSAPDGGSWALASQ